jgi:hypothetical protein
MISCRMLATSVLCAALFSSLGAAQDLAKYRDFQFGMSLESVAKQIHMDASAAKTTHQRPAVIQRLQWDQLGYSDRVLSKNSIRTSGARRDPLSIWSCGVSIVIIEHSAEPLTLSHRSRLFSDSIYWNDEPVAKPLMISLEVIMCNELPNRFPQSVLTEEDHLLQTPSLIVSG